MADKRITLKSEEYVIKKPNTETYGLRDTQ